MSIANSIIVLVSMFSAASIASAQDDCESVKGRITSELVAEFSNGEPCPSPLGLCTEGRFRGDLKGRFRFVANSLSPYVTLDPSSPLDVAATTGVITLNTKFCNGTLVFDDTATFSLAEDGYYASVDTINSLQGSGGCIDATGRIRQQGVFDAGCVDCKYVGEVCGVALSDDDDDD